MTCHHAHNRRIHRSVSSADSDCPRFKGIRLFHGNRVPEAADTSEGLHSHSPSATRTRSVSKHSDSESESAETWDAPDGSSHYFIHRKDYSTPCAAEPDQLDDSPSETTSELMGRNRIHQQALIDSYGLQYTLETGFDDEEVRDAVELPHDDKSRGLLQVDDLSWYSIPPSRPASGTTSASPSECDLHFRGDRCPTWGTRGRHPQGSARPSGSTANALRGGPPVNVTIADSRGI